MNLVIFGCNMRMCMRFGYNFYLNFCHIFHVLNCATSVSRQNSRSHSHCESLFTGVMFCQSYHSLFTSVRSFFHVDVQLTWKKGLKVEVSFTGARSCSPVQGPVHTWRSHLRSHLFIQHLFTEGGPTETSRPFHKSRTS